MTSNILLSLHYYYCFDRYVTILELWNLNFMSSKIMSVKHSHILKCVAIAWTTKCSATITLLSDISYQKALRLSQYPSLDVISFSSKRSMDWDRQINWGKLTLCPLDYLPGEGSIRFCFCFCFQHWHQLQRWREKNLQIQCGSPFLAYFQSYVVLIQQTSVLSTNTMT